MAGPVGKYNNLVAGTLERNGEGAHQFLAITIT